MREPRRHFLFEATGQRRPQLARRAKAKQILKGFLTSVPFNVYLLMIVVMLFSIHIPAFVPTLLQPVADANSFCSVFMVGMLMDLPRTGKDVGSVLRCSVGACRSACCSRPLAGSFCRSMRPCERRR